MSPMKCGIVKGFMEIHGTEIRKLYVDPCFQSGWNWKEINRACNFNF